MEQIAFLLPGSGQPVFWREIILCAGILTAVLALITIRMWRKKPVFGVLLLSVCAAAASVYAGRIIHWYCCYEDYESFSAAVSDLGTGGFSLIGAFAGVLLVFGLGRLLHIIRDLPDVLDDIALSAGLGIGVGRMGEFFSAADRGKLIVENASLHCIPISAPVVDTISGQTEWRFATFAFQSLMGFYLFSLLVARIIWFRSGPEERRNRMRGGNGFLLFLCGYCLSQILLDSTRYDALFLRSNAFVSLEQILCLTTAVFLMVLYSVRSVKEKGRTLPGCAVLWLLFLGGFGLVGYMEYYVQRHGDLFLYSYGLMALGLTAVFFSLQCMNAAPGKKKTDPPAPDSASGPAGPDEEGDTGPGPGSDAGPARTKPSPARTGLRGMFRQEAKPHRLAAALFMALSFAAAGTAAVLCFRPLPAADTEPPAGYAAADEDGTSSGRAAPEISTEVFDGFVFSLSGKDWAGADGYLSEGSLGLDREPEGSFAAALWNAQQDAWEFSAPGDPVLTGQTLSRRYEVRTLDYSSLPDRLRPAMDGLLEEEARAASLRSDIYDENGEYRSDLLEKCLDQALETVLGDPDAFAVTKELTLRAEYSGGQWRILPDEGLADALTGGAASGNSAEAVAEAFGIYADTLLARTLEGLATVRIVYRLPEDTVVAPKPAKSGAGRSKKAADTAKVLAEAEQLIGDRKLIWSADKKTVADKWINWYRDDSIFAIAWRQHAAGMDLTLCEVVVGHPSQFRRYLADNSFKSRYRYTPTQMAKTVNAVVGISGDFYKYRQFGIVVYQGKLCRCEMKKLDTCFVDSQGNLSFVRSGAFKSREEVLRYIEDNDIRFSLAFGPVMVENGKNVVPTKQYPVGQILENYTRCSISQLGEGHYLVAVASLTRSELPLKKLANYLVSLGVDNAYALDGGQTASIVINGKLVNPVDFGEERMMSDILYFATAIPKGK